LELETPEVFLIFQPVFDLEIGITFFSYRASFS
jgi:hypothetical protein